MSGDPGYTCAVIISAYRASRWIEETLESVRRQDPYVGWRYTLRIGVDGCEETSVRLRELRQPHWFSPRNVGPYVMRNSLIGIEPADAYAIFDADDLMEPDYLRTLLRWTGDGIAGPSRRQIDENGVLISNKIRYHCGVSVFSHSAWERLGGYRDWWISADYDIICRARAADISVTRPSRPLYRRRKHRGSLTADPEIGWGTAVRWAHKEMAERLTRRGELHVEPVTTPLEYRDVSGGRSAA